MSSQALRKDITGLRAIAVLAVTFFHITHFMLPDNHWFSGGFLGVDIFFVISGYLMTMIIMRGIDQGNFSLYGFYKRRAKRICPALITVVFAFSLLVIVMLSHDSAGRIIKDGLRALGFVSNFRYATLVGYFDVDASERLFLHTWSLSVEWQFYLIYPILVWLLSKLVTRKYLGLILAALTIASLVFACIYTVINTNGSYYYLPSRAFELLTGSLAYFYPLSYFLSKVAPQTLQNESLAKKLAKWAELLGLVCIVVSLFLVDDTDGWPNLWAILPMFGTWLCIAANNQRTFLANPAFQYLGLWSYAIYLVHWPIISMFVILGLSPSMLILLVLIFVLGIALHYGVERRRNYGWIFFGVYFLAAGLMYCGVEWLKQTISAQQASSQQASAQTSASQTLKTLSLGNTNNIEHLGNQSRPVEAILVGDSFARQYLPVFNTKEVHIVEMTHDGCYSSPTSVNMRRSDDPKWMDKCSGRYDNLLKAAAQYPGVPVIWAQNWAGYNMYRFASKQDGHVVYESFEDIVRNDIQNTAQALEGHKLYILSAPRKIGSDGGVNLGRTCANLHAQGGVFNQALWNIFDCRARLNLSEQPINLKIKEFVEQLPQNQGKSAQESDVVYVDVNQALCNEQGCLVMDEHTFDPTFQDLAHLSPRGAEPIVDYILNLLQLTTAPKTEDAGALAE